MKQKKAVEYTKWLTPYMTRKESADWWWLLPIGMVVGVYTIIALHCLEVL